MSQNQQEFLKQAMQELGLKREDFARRLRVSWDTFRRWPMAADTDGTREMSPTAWSLVREVLEHEKLKKEHEELKIEHGKLTAKITKK